MLNPKDYLKQIKEWEYCYCAKCEKIIYAHELELTERGIQCSKCKGYDLEAPAWVSCPHEKVSAVKCPRAGKGIRKGETGDECVFSCSFRKS
jgi:hypothetical protein